MCVVVRLAFSNWWICWRCKSVTYLLQVLSACASLHSALNQKRGKHFVWECIASQFTDHFPHLIPINLFLSLETVNKLFNLCSFLLVSHVELAAHIRWRSFRRIRFQFICQCYHASRHVSRVYPFQKSDNRQQTTGETTNKNKIEIKTQLQRAQKKESPALVNSCWTNTVELVHIYDCWMVQWFDLYVLVSRKH